MANVLKAPVWTKSLRSLPIINHQTVDEIANKHSKTPKTSLQKGYKFFSGSYVHEFEGKFASPKPGSIHCKYIHVLSPCCSSTSENKIMKELERKIKCEKLMFR